MSYEIPSNSVDLKPIPALPIEKQKLGPVLFSESHKPTCLEPQKPGPIVHRHLLFLKW